MAEQARVCIYDPQVTKAQIWEEMYMSGCQDFEKYITVYDNAYDAAEDAHAVVILTEWDEFSNKDKTRAPTIDAEDSAVEVTNKQDKKSLLNQKSRPSSSSGEGPVEPLDWSRVMGLMQKPAFVFDGRRVVDVKKLEKLGFHVESIGRGKLA